MARSSLEKIAVIGGGSSYTPELIDGFIQNEKRLKVDASKLSSAIYDQYLR